MPGNRNDCKAWELSGANAAVGRATVIADGGYRGTGLLIPHRRECGQTELPACKEEHNPSHHNIRARVEHVFARMRAWKIFRDCRLKGDGVHTRRTRRRPAAQPRPRRPTSAPCETGEAQGRWLPASRLEECSVDTELVALDVQHRDARLVFLIGIQRLHVGRTERDQSCALGFERSEALVPHEPGPDPDVEVHPILNVLAFRDALEEQTRAYA
ncbi:transposase [Streptomyces sviceus ATCC 29083]|uniref:Transposase n=1 Tax=Streptomyces sviceus (strain ATCC 29083 / DSM 924 / JCM 4929 / NBRC 13980 / NCIMB 11184 / NRRL 5439 / UC 5370) TaxID=463191 RepID=D6XCI5_STRX2|nr:transposase [Streptomyces sviceus ATCC 29083]